MNISGHGYTPKSRTAVSPSFGASIVRNLKLKELFKYATKDNFVALNKLEKNGYDDQLEIVNYVSTMPLCSPPRHYIKVENKTTGDTKLFDIRQGPGMYRKDVIDDFFAALNKTFFNKPKNG